MHLILTENPYTNHFNEFWIRSMVLLKKKKKGSEHLYDHFVNIL